MREDSQVQAQPSPWNARKKRWRPEGARDHASYQRFVSDVPRGRDYFFVSRFQGCASLPLATLVRPCWWTASVISLPCFREEPHQVPRVHVFERRRAERV